MYKILEVISKDTNSEGFVQIQITLMSKLAFKHVQKVYLGKKIISRLSLSMLLEKAFQKKLYENISLNSSVKGGRYNIELANEHYNVPAIYF